MFKLRAKNEAQASPALINSIAESCLPNGWSILRSGPSFKATDPSGRNVVEVTNILDAMGKGLRFYSTGPQANNIAVQITSKLQNEGFERI